ncbi:AmmeMemoRadiSam system protein B [Treponema sp. OMZ 799]|uniref:AmmeMemoRadiSam system protein B n=1 Tax=Treponema sp. OMZ 799 TaxID=2563668 RepID=UPI0020A41514|nr:AmmeMemoRadiSam system protein B [Treponema sp. OMZ 799]UTC77225.1 AmmeMemoRadiSam system protein B [Treponema sp. OMZ 799]
MKFIKALFLICFCLTACTGRNGRPEDAEKIFGTWSSDGERPPATRFIPKEASLPEGAKPWGGTVSHHLLTDALINDWFTELADARDIKTFYVLSPSHWGLSLYDFSLTQGSWNTKDGLVHSEKEGCEKLARLFNVPFDDEVFVYEHGVSTLIPYIKKYFPEAKVVALAYYGEPPVNMNLAGKLYETIKKVFSVKDEDSFLLISSDFSHKSNVEQTAAKDAKSRHFLTSLKPSAWTLGICDNRPAMYLLSKLFTEKTQCTIQRGTDAYKLSDETDPEDITSYFFTYFWEKED